MSRYLDKVCLYIIKLKATVTLNFERSMSNSIGIIYTPGTNVCDKFYKPRSIRCQVYMQTSFGLYIKIMTVTVTLTFDQLTSKSIGIICTLTHMSVPNLMNVGRFCFLCLVIYMTFSLYINILMVTVTLTLDRLISKSIEIIYTPSKMSVSDLTKLCQFHVYLLSRQGLFYMSMITVTLTIDRLISKSIGIIYTPIQISVLYLRNLGQFCVKLSTGQGLVYISIC